MDEERGYSTDLTDDRTAATLNNSYLNIRAIVVHPNQSVKIITETYADETSFNEGKSPVLDRTLTYTPNDPEWDTFFSKGAVQNPGQTLTTRAIGLLKTRHPERPGA